MKRYAVIGQNIDYSLSPLVHQSHFDALNIDAKYECLNTNDIFSYIHQLRQLSGFNVTIPFKEKMASICLELSEEAKVISAVNCVKVIANQFYGYNTDVYGFYKLLEINDLLSTQKKVLMIGAGGAAKAVFYCLKKYTCHQVFVANRTESKALALTHHVLNMNEVSNQLDEFDIVINCTNVGVNENISPIEINKIKPGACFIDINYQVNSLFLDNAKKINAKTINGLDMFIYQAKKSFEIWFNQDANVLTMYQSIRKG